MMNEIEKASFAIKLADSLLSCDEKIKAIALIRALFGSDLREAKLFVEQLQAMKKGDGVSIKIKKDSILSLNLSVRSRQCLMEHGNFVSIAAVAEASDAELRAIKNLGETCLREIRTQISHYYGGT